MILFVLICVLGGTGLLFWVLAKGRCAIRLVAATVALIGSLFCGYVLGEAWQSLRSYDQYIYNFTLYERRLRALVDRQEIAELTNAVVLFDEAFYPRQDPGDLQDVVLRILKEGRYYQPETNWVGLELGLPINNSIR